MPRFLIDEGLSSRGQMSGIGHYIVNLAAHIKVISDCELTQYELAWKFPRYFRKWVYIGLANIPALYKTYDVVHHLANYVPFERGNNKHLLTVHDLSIFRYPETVSIAWRHYNAHSFRKSIARADALISVSKSVQSEIVATFPDIDTRRMFVCYPGIRPSIFTTQPHESDLAQIQIEPFSYFLFIGDLTKRKNLRFALTAFLEGKRQKRIHDRTQFIIVGKPAWGYSEIKTLLEEGSGVKSVGYLSDQQITSLYRYTKALIYPSIYEGFGIPLVEAMSQGTPIIISTIPTSMEINGNHHGQMFTFNLGDQEGFTRCLEMLDSEFQSIRAKMNYGDLSAYSFDRIAERHIEIYDAVLKMEPRA